MSIPTNQIIHGDCLKVMRGWPDECVDMVLTSPPYWAMRDYGVAGQVGLESTPDLYVQHLVEIFREVRRVIKKEGTLWLNLGDSYSGVGTGHKDTGKAVYEGKVYDRAAGNINKIAGLKPKDLIGIPWRVAFALQSDGWYLRLDIIWSKPNAMPENVTDRPTKSHEYLFLLAKNQHYFFNQDAVREPHMGRPSGNIERKHRQNFGGVKGSKSHRGSSVPWVPTVKGRNIRSVWTIPTQPFRGARGVHFAAFPERLCGAPIMASSKKGEIVFDPFVGVGTSCLVARNLGRKFIGIDLKEEYVKIAIKRLALDQHTLDSL